MSKLIGTALAVLLTAFGPSIAFAATPEDAKALLHEAITYYHEHGADQTFAEINNTHGRFRRGELYIFVYDGEANVVAHGVDPGRIGVNRIDQQDEDGKFFAREIMSLGEEGGSVDYVWENPETGKVQPKTSFIMRVDEYRFGCGIYR
jgi:cytochrome c